MVTAVRANPALYRAQLDPLAKNACYVEIRKECGRQNLPSAGETRKQWRQMPSGGPASSTLTDMRRECHGQHWPGHTRNRAGAYAEGRGKGILAHTPIALPCPTRLRQSAN
jgi:hypothetical protein